MGPAADPGRAARTGTPTATLRPQLATPSAAAGRLAAWEESLYQALADLSQALLLTHTGVDDQHRTGQDRDHPLQRRELPLGSGHLVRAGGAWGGAALHWDVTGPLQLLAQ